MPATMTLVTRPYAVRRMYPQVLQEVRKGYEDLAKIAIGVLEDNIAMFSDEHKPTFTSKITVSKGKWQMVIKYDARTRAGKVYRYVDEGTGMAGGYREDRYVIRPKKAKALHFFTPFIPKTQGRSGVPPMSSLMPEAEHFRQAVLHPGIDPRHFNKELFEHLKSRRPGSFRNVTEAAVKRGFRRSGLV